MIFLQCEAYILNLVASKATHTIYTTRERRN